MKSIADIDLIQLNFNNECEKNRKNMMNRLKYMNSIKEKNPYLSDIISDYNRYYKNIIKEKQNIKNNIEKLLSYLDNLVLNGNLNDIMSKRVEFQKKKLIIELKCVKKSLSEINSLVK